MKPTTLCIVKYIFSTVLLPKFAARGIRVQSLLGICFTYKYEVVTLIVLTKIYVKIILMFN